MSQEQWEKLKAMPNEYEYDPTIVERAKRELANRPAPVKVSWFRRSWKPIAACAASLALIVGVGLPVYNHLTAPPSTVCVYYDSDDLTYDDNIDIATLVAERNLPVRYFADTTLQARCATVQETGEIAFLSQQGFHINGNNFEEICLRMVLKQNVELPFADRYNQLLCDTSINNISIAYDLHSTNGNKVLAKFSYQGADYYLEVTTNREPLECVNAYLGMLFDE